MQAIETNFPGLFLKLRMYLSFPLIYSKTGVLMYLSFPLIYLKTGVG